MELLERVEFGQESVEAAEELERCGGIEIYDIGEGEAEEKIVGSFPCESLSLQRRHAGLVWSVEHIGVKPEYLAFVSTESVMLVQHSDLILLLRTTTLPYWSEEDKEERGTSGHTLSGDSPRYTSFSSRSPSCFYA